MKESSLNPIIDAVEHVQQGAGYDLVLKKTHCKLQPNLSLLDGTNVEYMRFDNTAPINVLGMKGGQDTQTVTVLGDGFTTIKHNQVVAKPYEKFMTNSGADKLLLADHAYHFTRYVNTPTSQDGRWVEIA